MEWTHGPALLDLNTQRQFFSATPRFVQAESLLEPLKKLMSFALRSHLPLISTRLRGVSRLGQAAGARPLCESQSDGYRKLPITLLRRRVELPYDCGTDLPEADLSQAQQVLVDLASFNPFENPRLDRLLSESHPGLWVVFGGPLELSVRLTVLGLLQRRAHIALIPELLGSWDPYEADLTLRQLGSKNIAWISVPELIERYAGASPRRAPTASARETPMASPNSPSPSASPRHPALHPRQEYRM